jgi:hypothetical protein
MPSIGSYGVSNFLPGLASNNNPPNLCLWSHEDYRFEPLYPAEQHFSKKEVRVTNKYMKKYSTTLAVREIQIKIIPQSEWLS